MHSITMKRIPIAHWRTSPDRVLLRGSGGLRRERSSAGCITNTSVYEFSVHTGFDDIAVGCRAIERGVALLRGFVTPSLAAQGRQRLPSDFNIQRGNPLLFMLLLASIRTTRQ